MKDPMHRKALADMSRRDLARWARNNAERDQLVRAAAAAGLPKTEIYALTGIARTTIDRILAPASSPSTPPPPASSTPARKLPRPNLGGYATPRPPAAPVVDEPAAPELADVDVALTAASYSDGRPEPEPAAPELARCCDDCGADLVAGELHRRGCALVDEPGPLVVIGCGAGKLDRPAPAAELYTGTYFRECLATARAIADPESIRILSAKHGLVRLDDVLEPYDVTLGDPFDRIPTRAVTAQAIDQGIAGRRVLALCSARYADLLRAAGFKVDAPLANLGIGRQRRKLAEMRRA